MTKPRSVADRFWPKVNKTETCWLWTASTSGGYGRISRGGRGNGFVAAHRWAYETLVGPIPRGLQLDHLCRVRNCVNPDHLEPVTHRTNTLRGVGITARRAAQTHCVNGHEFTPDNTHVWRQQRTCRACKRAQKRRKAASRYRVPTGLRMGDAS